MSLITLNPEQQQAVAHRGSRLAVVAGAGTGKTQVITHRIASLVADGVAPSKILAVTFTNKAAKEMRSRLFDMRVKGVYGFGEGMWIGTFHATGARILRRMTTTNGQPYCEFVERTDDFQIYDVDDQNRVVGMLLAGSEIDNKVVVSNVRKCISILKVMGEQNLKAIPPEQLPFAADGLPAVEEAFSKHRIFGRYEARLLAANAMDFDDLLIDAVAVLDSDEGKPLRGKFDHVLVDEYQDTSPLQREMVNLLDGQNLCVAGDDDQAIYGWRGADAAGMFTFADQEDVKVVKLERNYRSTVPILDCANAVIRKNPERLLKNLWTDVDGESIRVCRVENEEKEADHVVDTIVGFRGAYEDHAVLYRTNGQSKVFEDALRRRGIPYVLIGGTRFYDREVIKDILAYFIVAVNLHSDVHLLRVANKPTRGLGKKIMESIKDCVSTEGISAFSAFTQFRDNPKVQAFLDLLARLHELASTACLPDLFREVLGMTGYKSALDKKLESESEKVREKAINDISNLEELANELSVYHGDHPEALVGDYLEQVALVAKNENQVGAGGVNLITIHSAKGLEFPFVHLVGFEEGLLPHALCHTIEEERRLAYVAITRAMRFLDVTIACRRRKWGFREPVVPSRFWQEFPASCYRIFAFEEA